MMNDTQKQQLVEDIKEVVAWLTAWRTEFRAGDPTWVIAPPLNDVLAALGHHRYAQTTPKSGRRWVLSQSHYSWFTETEELFDLAGFEIRREKRSMRVYSK